MAKNIYYTGWIPIRQILYMHVYMDAHVYNLLLIKWKWFENQDSSK